MFQHVEKCPREPRVPTSGDYRKSPSSNQGKHGKALGMNSYRGTGLSCNFHDNYLSLFLSLLAVNLMAIVILSRGRCGLSGCITKYLVSMAVTDLLVIITAVLLNRIPAIYFPGSFLSITPVCSLTIALIYASRDTSVWLTVAFTFDRFVAICFQRLKTKYCTERTAVVVITTICVLGSLKSVPWYFIHEPMLFINDVPWYCRVKEFRYTSPLWRAFDWLDRVLTPLVPFLLILMLNVLTVRFILAASKARKRLRAQNNREKQSDPEIENRRKSIILLFAISGNFIILWIPNVVQFCLKYLTINYQITNISDPRYILQESANMLQLLNSCTNTFIYAVTQSSFRKELKDALKYPLIVLGKIIK
ncbi:probable G-protein coupled receptor 139 [Leucoraja erinacea]|uniref:probable G-protein coupled receptor 139 n=1 Tax=Leucoraja erinaceus TaxID=7782 RepID=UPI002456D9E4|nr:probable G-protein coupled receptor 139 [Leucoraja erinacea]